jgi:hypothetical protein
MTTIRRLSDDDVRSIFESLHGGSPPPSHLNFSIVPVGQNGLKLSPPSFEFEGKYVFDYDNVSSKQTFSGSCSGHFILHRLPLIISPL